MASGKGANIAKCTILLLLWGSLRFGEMDDSAAFVGFPSFRQLSAAGNPENPKGPGNGFRKRSAHCEMDEFAASPHFGSFRRPEIQKIQGALEMASGKGANIGKWTIVLLLWRSLISAAFGGRKSRKSKEPWKWLPEKERTLGNGRCCCFCGVPLISAAFGGRKSRKSKGPWKWLPEKERTLRNGRFCCFCGVPLISAAFGGRKSRKSRGPWKWLPEKERTLGNGRFCCFCGVPLISAAFGGRKSRKSKGPWKWLPEKERTLRNGRFCCFCRVPLISAAFGGRKSRKSTEPGNGTTILLLLGFPSFWQLSAAGNPENPRSPGNGALEMASGKGANIGKLTILLLLWGSPHFGSFRRPEIQKI